MPDTDQWWREPALRGELDAILSLINEARGQIGRDEEAVARKLCDALNRAWNARAQLESGPRPDSDRALLKALICSLPADDELALLRSGQLRDLAMIDPPILNHRKLLDRNFLGSAADIPDPVRREASEAHRRLLDALDDLPDETTSARIGGALVRMADLLYVIRSNLQHGEKFASTDPARIARDRVIAEKAAAVFELFFDLLFARPSTALAVYGSLAPGGVHHDQLDSIVGEWMQGAVRGRFRDGPFPRLDPTPAAGEVSVQLLWNADGLPDLWSQWDTLEGNDYRRVLVAVETGGAGLVIANLYAA
jgi:gamma-glutamylcyclotransferase (GGCT)/AIG2-like uncharacterized protein YtfP